MAQQQRKASSSSAKVSLKRSKSVRASLRSISTKFLHLRTDDLFTATMRKSPSMSNLREKRTIFEPGAAVETILKTPRDGVSSKPSRAQLILGFHRKRDVNVSTPPPLVAPKAAAILQIPIQEDGFYKTENNNSIYREHQEDFCRSTLRLSVTTKTRRTSLFHSTSMFLFRSFIIIFSSPRLCI